MGVTRNEVVLNCNLQLGTVNISTTENYDIPNHPFLKILLDLNVGLNYSNIRPYFSVIHHQVMTTLQGSDTTGIINALSLDNQNINLKSQFYNNVPNGNSYSKF